MTWLERCATAKTRKRRRWLWPFKVFTTPHFTEDEKRLAKNWGTCAFGEAFNLDGLRVPIETDRPTQYVHDFGYPPADPVLQSVGAQFYYAVRDDKPAVAEEFLRAVRARLQFLCGAESVEMTLKNLEQATHADLDRH